MKGSFTRGGQQFQFPVVVSHAYDDWRVLAGAYVVPPLLTLGLRHLVVRPLARRRRVKKVRWDRVKDKCTGMGDEFGMQTF